MYASAQHDAGAVSQHPHVISQPKKRPRAERNEDERAGNKPWRVSSRSHGCEDMKRSVDQHDRAQDNA